MGKFTVVFGLMFMGAPLWAEAVRLNSVDEKGGILPESYRWLTNICRIHNDQIVLQMGDFSTTQSFKLEVNHYQRQFEKSGTFILDRSSHGSVSFLDARNRTWLLRSELNHNQPIEQHSRCEVIHWRSPRNPREIFISLTCYLHKKDDRFPLWKGIQIPDETPLRCLEPVSRPNP